MQTDKKPSISVVICTYNREKFIGDVLNCLAKQTFSADLFEIIVVDNNSTDRTPVLVKEFIQATPGLPVSYVFEKNKGLSFARNRGLEEANGAIITYLDDDAEPIPVFLTSIQNFLQENKEAVGIGGKVIPKYSESKEPAWMNKY
ncbi:MAG: glycosyltransferase, partial [Chitinophagaceae bacterium]